MRKKWYAQPWLHFLILGIALFAGSQFQQQRAGYQIEALDTDTLQRLRDDWIRQTGRLPSAQQMRLLQEQELQDRMLFAEALRRQYHRDDTVVLRRLLRDADFLGLEGSEDEKIRAALDLGVHLSDEVIRRRMIQRIERSGRLRFVEGSASEAVLRELYRADPERWTVPASYRFSHVFYSVDRAGDPGQRAQQDLARLEASGNGPVEAAALGDPFLHGRQLPLKTLNDLAAMFGAQFSDALHPHTLREGAWIGPVPSAYGQHLLWLHEQVPARQRSFAEVRPKLLQQWREQQERESLKKYVAQLSERYQVVVE